MKVAVIHNGETLATGLTEDEAFVYILKHQSQSVDWAMKYEGWEIVEEVSQDA